MTVNDLGGMPASPHRWACGLGLVVCRRPPPPSSRRRSRRLLTPQSGCAPHSLVARCGAEAASWLRHIGWIVVGFCWGPALVARSEFALSPHVPRALAATQHRWAFLVEVWWHSGRSVGLRAGTVGLCTRRPAGRVGTISDILRRHGRQICERPSVSRRHIRLCWLG